MMADQEGRADDAGQLRRRAEEVWRQRPERVSGRSPEEAMRLLHELEVHQIELEMQNAELRRAQDELEMARARYFDLFDLAPVGYVTLDDRDLIQEANLTAANLLNQNRSQLLRQSITHYIFHDDQDVYYRYHRRLSDSQQAEICELRMVPGGAGSASSQMQAVWVRMQGTMMQEVGGTATVRLTLSDISERKRMDEELRASRADLQSLSHLSHRQVELQENERYEVANQLYNNESQRLTALLLGLARLGNELTSPAGAALLAELKELAQGVLLDIHTLAVSLRPISLDRLELKPALQQLIRQFETQSGMEVQSQLSALDGSHFVPQVKTTIYRLVQEALANIAPQAGAHSLSITAARHDRHIVLVLEDDGLGFDLAAAERGSGLGLLAMRERAEAVGGTLTVESERGKGTALYIQVPEPDS